MMHLVFVLTFVASSNALIKTTDFKGVLLPQLFLTGGQAAAPGEIPWLATVRNEKDSPVCGATIFQANFLLTAAHCFDDFFANRQVPNINKWTVTVGQHDRNINDDSTVIANIEEVILHPEYDELSLVNDIAIIKLNLMIKWDGFKQPARISDSNFAQHKIATVVGWGFAHGMDPFEQPHMLQLANVPVYTNDECYEILREENYAKRIHMSQLCAGKRGIATQRGDSGGGLYAQIDGNWTVGGIVSHNLRHTLLNSRLPAIYTRVSSYKEWIRESCINHEYYFYDSSGRIQKNIILKQQ